LHAIATAIDPEGRRVRIVVERARADEFFAAALEAVAHVARGDVDQGVLSADFVEGHFDTG
jgi:hypothetical protein